MKEYDFYYSAQRLWYLIEYYSQRTEKHVRCYFKGEEFTEQVEKGHAPTAKHSDNVLIGTGTMNDVTYQTFDIPIVVLHGEASFPDRDAKPLLPLP